MSSEVKYLSICSGMEAVTVAWHSLGFIPVAFAEIEKTPSAVLTYHYPNIPNWGDITKFKEWPDADIDVLVGGTPCQSFSVAGLRRGLADPRGNLMLTYLAILDKYRPAWMVWENVPGVLSSNKGRDFGSFLGALGELGYGWAYRSLDAQYFHLAQRRERVFVVGCLRGWERAAQVLLEPEGMSGYPPPSRKAGQGSSYDAAPCLAASGRGFERPGDSRGQDCIVAFGGNNPGAIDVATTVNACGGIGRLDFESETFVTCPLTGNPYADNESRDSLLVPTVAPCLTQNYGKQPDNSDTSAGPMLLPVAFSCKDYGADASDIAPTLRAMGHSESHANAGGQLAVAFNLRGREGGAMPEVDSLASMRAASGGSSRSYVATQWAVRRLTPGECERLQGFPDDYSLVSFRGKPMADGPRYKMLGNSMAVPVMRWIGQRIMEFKP